MGTYKSHLLRCHAPYVNFINTEEYNQQFWNMLESKFEYFIANSEASDQMKKMKVKQWNLMTLVMILVMKI